jgi:hypothetical protein
MGIGGKRKVREPFSAWVWCLTPVTDVIPRGKELATIETALCLDELSVEPNVHLDIMLVRLTPREHFPEASGRRNFRAMA